MEIPELNIISDFAPGINSLHKPSLFSSQISTPPKLPQHLHSFWKWGALIFTLIATFRAIITRTKLLFLRFCTDKFLSPKHPPTQHLNYDSDTDDSTSSASSEDYQDHDPMTPFQQPMNENAKPWVFNSLGLGFGYEEENSGNVVAIWDVNKGQRLHSFSPAVFLSAGMNNKGNVLLSGPRASGNGCPIDSPNMRSAQASPAKWTACIVKPNILRGSAHYATYSTLAGVILSAGVNRKGNVLLSGYDRRVGREIPVICAEWRWRQMGKQVVVFNYGEKVYVRDDATGGALMVVGDIRNAKTPLLEDRTGCDGDAWLDVDTVSFWDEFVDS